jgi:hypothetical protein
LIDTLESFEAAEEVKKAFREKVPNKPIVAIILVTFCSKKQTLRRRLKAVLSDE